MGYVIYLCFAVPLAALSIFLNRSGRRFFFLFGALLFILIVPFSYKVGTDWYLYENSYYDNGLRGVNPDFLYKAVMGFFHGIGVDFDLFAVLNRLVYAFSILYFVGRYTSYGLLALVAIISSSFVFLNDSLRQQLAAIFCLLAIFNIEKSGIRFLFLIALGSLFHASAIFALPAWLLYRSNFLLGAAFVVGVLFFFLSYFGFGLVGGVRYLWLSLFGSENIISYKISVYSDVQPSVFGLAHVMRFILFCVYFFIYFGVVFSKNRGNCFDSTARMFFVGAFLMFFYEMVFFDAETFWRRLKEFFVLFFVLFPIYTAESYMGKNARIFVFLMILIYVCYVSFSFFGSSLFRGNYIIYSNYIFSSIFLSSDEGAYARAIDFWDSWKPAGRGEF